MSTNENGPVPDDELVELAPADSPSALLSPRHALGAGIGLAVVVTTYAASGYGDDSRWWAAALTILVSIALVDLLPAVRRLLPAPGVAPLTIVAALVAIYACVPETDQILVAAFLPVLLVVLELVGRCQLGVEWYAVAAAAVLWAGMFGATGRQSALVGALFAWWAVALVPLVNAVRPIRSTRTALAVAAIGAIAAVVMARTGGIADTDAPAWLAAVIAAVVSFGIAVAAVQVLGDGPDDAEAVSATP